MNRTKPQQWLSVFHCQHGHFHAIWERNGKREHVTIPLEKLANILVDHGHIEDVPCTVGIGIFQMKGAPIAHPRDLN